MADSKPVSKKTGFLKKLMIPTGIIAAIIAIATLLFPLLTSHEKQKVTEGALKVSEKQKEASVESGRDAVNTVAQRIVIETRTHTITKDNTREIEALNTTAPTFPDDLQRAGIAGLCKYDVYRDTPRCVQ